MDILDTHLVKIGAMADNKADAIGHVVDLLVEADKIDPRYRESMLGREKVANTFLGNGIAIPHGLPKDRELIKQTAIAVAQFPDGVEWAPGDKVHLVVGIAAKSDEHLQILSNLTGVLGEPEEAARLATTTNPADIVGRLTGMHASSDKTEKNTLDDFEAGFDIVIRSPHGLHARPATALIELAKRYQSSIRIRYKDKVADAKSLISLLNLGIGANDSVRVMAEGDDAEQALSVLKETIELGLDDDEEEDRAFISTIADSDEKINYEGSTKAGISSSPGFAIGPIFQFSHERIVVEVTAKDPAHELERLDHALNTAHRQLDELYQEVWKKSGPAKASIFRAHQEFLEDPEMINEAQAMIRDGHSAGYAWQQAFEDRANVLASMKDPLLSGRAVDLRDAGRRALRQLASSIEDSRQLPVVPCVLVADDLTPSDTAQLDPSLVLGLCTAAGGPTSHTSIIARSLDIPAVVGAGASVLDIPTGTSSLLDGSHGLLVVDPTEVDREFAEKSIYDLKLRRDMEQANCFKPAITTDGQRIEVVANISDLEDAAYAVDAGGEGVGLLRTEFLFVNRDAAPSESEQEDIYVGMIKAMNGLPIIIRTLDIGGDKEIPYLYMPAEDNPFLGERGIRFCFSHQDLFRSQLRVHQEKGYP
ncbi:MAG: HPr family phosphocarrier protein, partial [Chromatiales bacterium]